LALVEVGRVCVKRYGRDAGSRAVITKILDKNFVNIITAERQKERRCNVKHLEFLGEVVDINDKKQVSRALGVELAEEKTSSDDNRKAKGK
jgi:ribosomal protein L14E/L6E/L27E